MTIETKTVELFEIRNKEYGGWADIVLNTVSERSGRIIIASDWGNWSTSWIGAGPTFKAFLCTINRDYLAERFKEDNAIDVKATLNRLKEKVLYDRHQDSIPKGIARSLYDGLKKLESVDATDFLNEFYENQDLVTFIGGLLEPEYTVTHRFNNFWNKVWLPFIEHIKTQLPISNS